MKITMQLSSRFENSTSNFARIKSSLAQNVWTRVDCRTSSKTERYSWYLNYMNIMYGVLSSNLSQQAVKM